MKRLLFSTLFPEAPGPLREDENCLRILREAVAGFGDRYDVRFLGASAHVKAIEQMQPLLGALPIQSEVRLAPYQHHPQSDERRGHEIAFSKQWLARQWAEEKFDYLLFLDSDLYIPFADIDRCVELLADPLDLVSFPYILRDHLSHPHYQLGAFLHTRALLDRFPYASVIYRPTLREGAWVRRGAPDCNVYFHLAKQGVRVLRPTEIETHHYRSRETFGRFKNGRSTLHASNPKLPFHPLLNGMAMEPASLTYLFDTCLRRRVRTAVDLGTGSGNTLLTLLHAGTEVVATVDQHAHYLDEARDLTSPFHSTRDITFHPGDRKPAPEGINGHAYDLAALAGKAWDLVVVDGPEGDAWGRAASALQLHANAYFFHDAERDVEAISWFHGQLAQRGYTVRPNHAAAGRGCALFELSQSSPT